jgi:prepilin-type processing-associated H-X9-DG protein
MYSVRDVSDGTTTTFLLGEKYVQPECYYIGCDGGDNQPMFLGFDVDCVRFSAFSATQVFPPMQDTPGLSYFYAFGSAHPGGSNYAMVDGSVTTIAYDVDMPVFHRLCNRRDGEPVEAGAY